MTPNDPGDADAGANQLQNFPVLTPAPGGAGLTVALNSRSTDSPFRIELFSNAACDPSGHGEGERLLQVIENVSLDSSGNFARTIALPSGRFFTATATDRNGNTSEFSACAGAAPPFEAFIVNSTSDRPDRTTGDGRCDTGETIGGRAECTLRAAIQEANSKSGTDVIRFNIAGMVPHRIQPGSPLPIVTDPVTIDGSSQPGFDTAPVVELNGLEAGSQASGLEVAAGNSTIKGLIISQFKVHGILIRGSGANRIVNNLIGTDSSVSRVIGNVHSGIAVSESANNIIGGEPVDGNVIAGNGNDAITEGFAAGIFIAGTNAKKNVIAGNAILANVRGIFIIDASGTTIGGETIQRANAIRFNVREGIVISGAAVSNSILVNSISDNGALGIDLAGDGPEGIDLRDADTGPNGLQNAAEIYSATATASGDTSRVRMRLRSAKNETFTVRFFTGTTPDPSGYGEGDTFVLTRNVTTSDSGYGPTSFVSPVKLGKFLSCTVTDAQGNTSEFSAAAPIKLDSDGDSVSDEEENLNGGDANGDFTPDRLQPNVQPLTTSSGRRVAIEVSQESVLTNASTYLAALAGATLFEGQFGRPLGFYELFARFTVGAKSPFQVMGGSTTVTLFVPPELKFTSYLNYGPTPDNPTPHFYQFMFDGKTGAEFKTGRILLHLVDGQRGDHDLAANGEITTLGGPVIGMPNRFFIPLYRSDPSTFTGYAVSNFSARDANIQFTALDFDGIALSTLNNPSSFLLKPGNQLALLGRQVFSDDYLDPQRETTLSVPEQEVAG
ncbi:MAG: right-handed parallel beta-helix repeat-containing protein [Acidobacteria bacterium]|nr:right-handed parallel beta-helix repeat-containing protein [Acidobacteriota bacterium]